MKIEYKIIIIREGYLFCRLKSFSFKVETYHFTVLRQISSRPWKRAHFKIKLPQQMRM